MSPALHELEAARRELPYLFAGGEACCFLDFDSELEPCPNHEYPFERPEDNPTYRTLETVLEEAIKATSRPIRAQAARTVRDNNRGEE